jgi:uncharacterized protein (TIGR02145 family)
MKKTILIVLLLVVQSSFSQIIMASFQGALSSKIAVVVPKTTVTIGTQVWTTKNLDVATYSDGTVIPEVQDPTAWAALTTGAWCYYNNESANGVIYGKLYNWYAVVGIHDEASKTDASKRKKLASIGFHVPTNTEWTTLTDFLDGADSGINTFPFPNNISGGAMKETGIKHWLDPNAGATNLSGFTGLPGGYSEIGFFNKINENGYFWSSSENQTTDAWYRTLFFQNGYISRAVVLKQDGFSVRLVKNTVPSAPTITDATAGNKKATVSFTAPVSDGGSAITEYTVTSSPASSPATFTGTTSPIVVTGLTNGTSYTFTVVATNEVGNSVASAASVAVTPAAASVCGANVSAGVFKVFACHNLGADTTLDPNTPVQGIHGDYYQWGRSTVVADASTASGAISGWNTASAANGAWTDDSKTVNDPCPTGFRVPTKAQWNGVKANNTVSRTGSWSDSATNFSAAISFGTSTTKTLTLPAAGFRTNYDGTLIDRGNYGFYWSSSEDDTSAWYLYFDSSISITTSNYRTYGFSVRCVSE